MHVLMVSDVFFPRVNGVSTSIETFREALTAQGHRVTVVAPDYRGRRRTLVEADGTLVRIPARRVPFDPEDRFMSRRAIARLLPWLRARGVDRVHVQTPFVAHGAGRALARALAVPVLATYHTFFEEYLHHYLPLVPAGVTRALARRVSRRQCNEMDRIIVPSRAMAEVLRDYGVQAPLSVLPTGIPLERFARGDGHAFRRRYDIATDRPVMLTVSRMAFEKNLDFLLDVLARLRRRLPRLLFLMAGEGPMRPHLARRVAAEGLSDHVRFLGYLDRERELTDCYQAADVFVFASRTETQGLVLLEAMAAGLPVVALAEMGTRDVLQEGRGCRIARDDVVDFAAKVERVLVDNRQRRRLADSGRRHAREWAAPVMAERLAEIYAAMRPGDTRPVAAEAAGTAAPAVASGARQWRKGG